MNIEFEKITSLAESRKARLEELQRTLVRLPEAVSNLEAAISYFNDLAAACKVLDIEGAELARPVPNHAFAVLDHITRLHQNLYVNDGYYKNLMSLLVAGASK